MTDRNRTLRVAAAQLDVELGDLTANIDKHLEWIARAREQGVELLVFPELSLTGYCIGHEGYRYGIAVGDAPLLKLAEAAGDMTVLVGFVEEGEAAQFFCAAAVLQRGRVEFVHRKLNLPNYGAMQEGKFFAPGRYIETFTSLKPFTGAVLLCADMWNPALVHLAALHGTTLLLVPTNSSLDAESGDVSKPGTWDIVLKFYSLLYGMPIVFCNRIGTEESYTFWGRSRIVDAHGDVLEEASGTSEELIVADLTYEHVRRARFELPTVRDSNLSLIHREVDRLATRVGVPERIRHQD